ncbi:hydroxyacid dehydrogenase [Neomoorella mulderi]|uniref:Hydroxypyruvate reductase n=1 Tax=Moorella mulderi DSM 14980 TaxID=1122241 RepID=A0A151ATP0_9FIRM|nr:hydroxyacid dehydrogenase [Moorella mulderi]KYH31034.1 hydroxypyruvate reductase [Moorella mulderi DSM 14980]
MTKVFVTGKVMKVGVDMLRGFADVEIIEDPRPEILEERLKGADGILHKVGKLSEKVLRNNEHLKIIARHGVGLDDIDLSYVKRKGIWLTTTDDANTNAVAEFTIGLIFAVVKNIVRAHIELTIKNRWMREDFMGEELSGKILGIIGYGRIGKKVADLAKGCGLRVIAYDPNVDRADCELLPLKDVVSQADFLSIHCPLTDETRGLINCELLSRMKPSAFIINTARGGVIEEDALVEALQERRIRGAALDVFALEPIERGNSLLNLDNVVLTPHIAAMTEQSQEKMAVMAAQEIRRVLLEGREPLYPVW